ncbi:sugar nucleotide-binding protein [Pseudomaricurvus sp. HS19]|uniref:sugar nucleotide-binding protein n=1 Tax=Pseudomaricurvus sp. HS19 TaxID=2692626 RepID=UPI00136909B7|nr:sugar nucleotide-binding protein [Pseudomaricurvus sp. HS19]MYM62859.1 sugar nucleotide-binding protein [Pseudomaricurvus sp. HS19]
MSKKVHIIGSNGYVGKAIFSELSKTESIHTTGFSRRLIDNSCHPIESAKDYASYLTKEKPDFLILATGSPSVDASQIDPDTSLSTNFIEPSTYLNALLELSPNTIPVLISSIYVFSPQNNNPLKSTFDELSPPNPSSVYGQHKLLLEDYTIDNFENFLILRLPFLLGNQHSKSDFINTVVNSSSILDKLEISDTGRRFPTDVVWTAKKIKQLIEQQVTGIRHLSGSTAMTKYALACKILEELGNAPQREISIGTTNESWKRPDYLQLRSHYISEERDSFDLRKILIRYGLI